MSHSFDPARTAPPGYITAQQLAEQYQRTVPCIHGRMKADKVPFKRVPRLNAKGAQIGSQFSIVYRAEEAHAALRRPHYRPRSCSPGYIGLLARAFGLTRPEVKAVLDAAGLTPQQRLCPTCGKHTLYYNARPAAHAALCEHMRSHPLHRKDEGLIKQSRTPEAFVTRNS